MMIGRSIFVVQFGFVENWSLFVYLGKKKLVESGARHKYIDKELTFLGYFVNFENLYIMAAAK